MGLKDSLFTISHVQQGAKIVDFGGWDMPVALWLANRESTTAVRRDAGMFDVSHMCIVVD